MFKVTLLVPPLGVDRAGWRGQVPLMARTACVVVIGRPGVSPASVPVAPDLLYRSIREIDPPRHPRLPGQMDLAGGVCCYWGLTMTDIDELIRDVESLKLMMVARATGGEPDANEYEAIRRKLVQNPLTRQRLPRFAHTCRTPFEFWSHIKPLYETYAERRTYLQGEFEPLLSWLEQGAISPIEDVGSSTLEKVDLPDVHAAWQKLLDRNRAGDPDGALRAARTLAETVCKHILDDYEIDYQDDADLPRLYRLTADQLRLAPSQHTEKVFKQILGGCTAVVEGLGQSGTS